MIGIDTNIIIRFLTNDDPVQAKKVMRFFSQSEKNETQLFISSCVLLESIWVLESGYNFSKEDILTALNSLLHLPYITFENEGALSSFFNKVEYSKMDLSDALIGAVNKFKKCEYTLTFDKLAVSESGDFQLVK